MEQVAALWRARLLVVLFLVVFCAQDALAQASAKAEFMRAAIAQLEREQEEMVNQPGTCDRYYDDYDRQWKESCVWGMHSIATPRAFLDFDWFYIEKGLSWFPNPGPGPHFRPVEVPHGFVTDLASVPQIFWSVLPKTGRHAHAAIIQDYLYWNQTRSREEADSIFKIALQDLKVGSWTVEMLYRSVRWFGQEAWDANARGKAAGEKRILNRFPPNGLISWSEWRSQPGVFAD